MAELIRWDLQGIDATSGNERILPGSQGRGDKGYPYSMVAVPHPLAGAAEILGIYARAAVTPDYGHMTSAGIYTKAIGNTAVNLKFNFSGTKEEGPNLNTYSMSFIQECNTGYFFGHRPDILHVLDADDNVVWGLGWKESTGGNWDQNFNPGILDENLNTFGWHPYSMVQNIRYKYEIEVKPTAPKVTVRIYVESSYGSMEWSLWTYALTANPTNVAANKFVIGHPDYQYGITGPERQISRIRVWDTVDADGGFPNIDTPKVNRKAEFKYFDGTTFHDLEIEGYWNGSTIETDTDIIFNRVRTNSFRGRRERPAPPFTEIVGSYGNHENQNYVLYLPEGDPPSGGWPVIAWVVCDYFVTGYAAQMGTLDYQWIRNDWLHRGYAVMSIGVRNALPFNVGITPSRPTNGIWPDQIHDVKNATKHAIANRPEIDGSKIIIGGHSGGGFIACAAALTKGFNDTTISYDYRVSGGDPTFLGAYNINAPIELSFLQNWDLTHPYYNIFAGPLSNSGVLRAVIASLMGYQADAVPDVSKVSLPYFATQNPSGRLPMLSCTSGCDQLIPAENEQTLRDAYTDGGDGAMYTHYHSPGATHASCARDLPQETMHRWFQSLISP